MSRRKKKPTQEIECECTPCTCPENEHGIPECDIASIYNMPRIPNPDLLKIECRVEKHNCMVSFKQNDTILEVDNLNSTSMEVWTRFLTSGIRTGAFTLQAFSDYIKRFDSIEDVTDQLVFGFFAKQMYSTIKTGTREFGNNLGKTKKMLKQNMDMVLGWTPLE